MQYPIWRGLADSDAVRRSAHDIQSAGFAGVADKPGGWYLPKNKADGAGAGDQGDSYCPQSVPVVRC